MVEGKDGAKGVCAVGALLICNACLLQRRLKNEPGGESIVSLDKVTGAERPLERLADAWEAILDRDYAPVFTPALAALRALPHTARTEDAIRGLAECANRVADSLSELGYDHAGPLYHRVLGSAKSDGAFYTNNVSALMLAHLALADDLVDWSDPQAVAQLRIMDPACGTGTLLMAVLKTVKERVGAHVERDEAAHKALHKRLVEDVLCGLDVNPIAVQLAACNLTLGAPTVDYSRMNLETMPHGPQPDGTTKAGSIEILDTAEDDHDLLSVLAPGRALDALAALQVNERFTPRTVPSIRFPLRDLDVVIMNAPFTDNVKRGRKFSRDTRAAMQLRELEIRDALGTRDPNAAQTITTNSIRTFFTPLADRLLDREHAVLAKVIPATACTGADGVNERRFLAERFHVERIVTSHDPQRINFSENTSIHESLLVCRRWPDGTPRAPTEFVSLRRMPANAGEAIEAARAIASGRLADWGNIHHWPAERIQRGDWSAALLYDPTLLEAIDTIDAHLGVRLRQLGDMAHVGPAGQRARDAFPSEGGPEGTYALLWQHQTERQRTIATAPDRHCDPRPQKVRYVKNTLWPMAGHLLLCNRMYPNLVRTPAVWTDERALGSAWTPVNSQDRDAETHEKAWAAWLNSTPGILCLLARRAKKLTYPQFPLASLRTLPCPDPALVDVRALVDAFQRLQDAELQALPTMANDPARAELDAAAATVLGLSPDTLAQWRQRLAAEPTVTNERAGHDCR